MTKTELIAEIAAFADAKASANPLLISRSAGALKEMLDKLPEQLISIQEKEPDTAAS